MVTQNKEIAEAIGKGYQHGFMTDIETELAPPGINEEMVAFISHKKNEPDFMLQWRLQAYRYWLNMSHPQWAHINVPPIDYQSIHYYAAPKNTNAPKSLEDVDPKLLESILQIIAPLHERAALPLNQKALLPQGICAFCPT